MHTHHTPPYIIQAQTHPAPNPCSSKPNQSNTLLALEQTYIVPQVDNTGDVRYHIPSHTTSCSIISHTALYTKEEENGALHTCMASSPYSPNPFRPKPFVLHNHIGNFTEHVWHHTGSLTTRLSRSSTPQTTNRNIMGQSAPAWPQECCTGTAAHHAASRLATAYHGVHMLA